MSPSTSRWIDLDKRHGWHPFTQMRDWNAPDHDPLVLVSGEGCMLTDSEGREYLDGNSSIWTNIHGHNHPKINAAIREQLDRVAHVSFLGFTHPGAATLAARLAAFFPKTDLQRVFFSDDGSTAVEVAIKMTIQYCQIRGTPHRKRFISFCNAYHGDTIGAASLGGVPLFHDRFTDFQFPVTRVSSMDDIASLHDAGDVAAVIVEPLIQGVAGIRPWPQGMLGQLRDWCDHTGALLIFDEILTGFGRTGKMFACHHENVVPDFLCLAKGLTGGYLPLAATMVREGVFEAFLGTMEERRTFYYGHSYTANPLGCAAALASLDIFEEERTLTHLPAKIETLHNALQTLSGHPHVLATRQLGLISGIELCKRRAPNVPYDWLEQIGAKVCVVARDHGLLTRPIGDVLVFMPPLSVSSTQIEFGIGSLRRAIDAVCGSE